MISASGDFNHTLSLQKGFSSLETDVFTYGGDVPAAVSKLEDVKPLILDPLDTGGKCNKDSAKVTRVILKSWLSLPAIVEAAVANDDIETALMPKTVMSTDVLA